MKQTVSPQSIVPPLMAVQVQYGTETLLMMANSATRGAPIKFSSWRTYTAAKLAKFNLTFTGEDYRWIWNAVLSSPRLKSAFNCKVLSWKDEARRLPPVEILPKGSQFRLFVNSSMKNRVPFVLIEPNEPDAIVEIDEPLRLKYVKDDELEFCKVNCRLIVETSKLPQGKLLLSEEAAAFRVEESRILVVGTTYEIATTHFNEAMVLANNRFHRERPQSGGSMYYHVAYIRGNELVPIDYLRKENSSLFWAQLDKLSASELIK